MFSQLSTNKVDDVFSVVMFCWVVSSALSQNMLIMASLLSLKSFKIVYVPLILYLFNFSFQCPWLYMHPLVFAHVLLVLRVGLCLCFFLFCIPQSPCFRVHPAPPLFSCPLGSVCVPWLVRVSTCFLNLHYFLPFLWVLLESSWFLECRHAYAFVFWFYMKTFCFCVPTL